MIKIKLKEVLFYQFKSPAENYVIIKSQNNKKYNFFNMLILSHLPEKTFSKEE